MTLIDELTSTEEGRREWQKESATVDATEAICSLMESQSKTGEWVADKLGVSKRAFTRMLSGDGNITIRQLADIFAVLGATLNITVRQQRYDAGVKWNPVAIEPESFTHALCWAKWPDGSESFRRGYFDDGRWHLDWDGSFDNDDAVVLFWLPLTEVGITHNGNGQWSLERRAAIEAEQLELACNSIFGGVGACSPEIYETLIENVAKVCGRSVDDQFREDVKNAISKLPCPLD